jgi:hypothetical protein
MLVAAIDRNQASPEDKFVARVLFSRKCIPVAMGEAPSNFRRQSRKSVVLRYEDRRQGDRRNRPSESTASIQMGGQDYVVSLSPSAQKYRDQSLH